MSAPSFPTRVKSGPRAVQDVYFCDKKGAKIDGPSNYMGVKITVGPDTGSPFLYSIATQLNSWSNPYTLTFGLNELANIDSGGKKVKSLDINSEVAHYTTSADMFSAGLPICAAQLNSWISDDNIARLQDQHLFFIYSNDDHVVDPKLNEVPVIARLKSTTA